MLRTIPGRLMDFLSSNPLLWTGLRRLLEGRTAGDREYVRELVESHPGRWLDLGCGTGRYTPLFPAVGYLGTELSESRLRYAQRRLPGYRFRLAETLDLLAEQQSFDGVLVAYVLHHLSIHEARALLRDCHALLQPGGVLVMLEWSPAGEGHPLPHNLWHRIERPRCAMTGPQWSRELVNVGFARVESRPVLNRRFSFSLLIAYAATDTRRQ